MTNVSRWCARPGCSNLLPLIAVRNEDEFCSRSCCEEVFKPVWEESPEELAVVVLEGLVAPGVTVRQAAAEERDREVRARLGLRA